MAAWFLVCPIMSVLQSYARYKSLRHLYSYPFNKFCINSHVPLDQYIANIKRSQVIMAPIFWSFEKTKVFWILVRVIRFFIFGLVCVRMRMGFVRRAGTYCTVAQTSKLRPEYSSSNTGTGSDIGTTLRRTKTS
jgi:hypothetical protein